MAILNPDERITLRLRRIVRIVPRSSAAGLASNKNKKILNGIDDYALRS